MEENQFHMKMIKDLKDMMLQQVRSLYDADQVIYDSLPQLRNKAKAKDLKEFIDLELEEKLRQRHRMEMIFTILKEELNGETDEVMRCMAVAQKKLIERCLKNELSDTMMIIIARAIATHQINGYQTAISCAVGMEYPEIARLLRRGLRDEKGLEKRLGQLEEAHLKLNVGA